MRGHQIAEPISEAAAPALGESDFDCDLAPGRRAAFDAFGRVVFGNGAYSAPIIATVGEEQAKRPASPGG